MCPLKPTELAIIQEFAAGYTMDDIASRTNRPRNTLMDVSKKMRIKTGAPNMTALVAKALREGWIK